MFCDRIISLLLKNIMSPITPLCFIILGSIQTWLSDSQKPAVKWVAKALISENQMRAEGPPAELTHRRFQLLAMFSP